MAPPPRHSARRSLAARATVAGGTAAAVAGLALVVERSVALSLPFGLVVGALVALGFALDVRRWRRAPAVPDAPAAAPPALEMPAVPLRVLLAEDDPAAQRLTLQMLARLGLAADVAPDGETAVARISGADGADPYAVVLMDVEMPRMGGVEALRAVRTLLPPARQPRVLALTGHVDPGARARLAAAGFDGYLPKPLDAGALARALAPAMPDPTPPPSPTPGGDRPPRPGDAPPVTAPSPPAFVARTRPSADAEALRARLRAHVADLIGEEDDEFVADLSATFTAAAAALLAAARAAGASGDAAALAAVAHQMRGSAANVGLDRLAEAWTRVEQATGETEAADRLAAAAAETERAVEALAGV